jgi:hypothetical protein
MPLSKDWRAFIESPNNVEYLIVGAVALAATVRRRRLARVLDECERKMRRVPVSSSVVAEIGYDLSEQMLEVKFRSGRTYRYFGVPSSVHDEFLLCESKGRYFNERVRDAYRFDQDDSGR